MTVTESTRKDKIHRLPNNSIREACNVGNTNSWITEEEGCVINTYQKWMTQC